jgi:uncharacterized protein YjeT (DUF2065 family)
MYLPYLPYLIGALLIVVGVVLLRAWFSFSFRALGVVLVGVGTLIIWRYHTWLTGG